jgi:hypothetical protein
MKSTFLLLAALALAGCAMTTVPGDDDSRPAVDVPERFELPEAAHSAAEPMCWSPVTDPRDGTRLVLVRSAVRRGDYEVPAGRYGVAKGELLRLRCATGEVIGIVPR